MYVKASDGFLYVNKIRELALGLDNSYVEIEFLDFKVTKVKVRMDKKRFNDGPLHNQYYFKDNNGSRVYVNEVKALRQ